MPATGVEKYAGKSFDWCGKTYILAPIGLGYMERVMDLMGKMEQLTQAEQMKAMKSIIYRSLQRNYPDLTQQEIDDEVLDLTNMKDVWRLVLESSGLVTPAAAVKTAAEAPQTSAS